MTSGLRIAGMSMQSFHDCSYRYPMKCKWRGVRERLIAMSTGVQNKHEKNETDQLISVARDQDEQLPTMPEVRPPRKEPFPFHEDVVGVASVQQVAPFAPQPCKFIDIRDQC